MSDSLLHRPKKVAAMLGIGETTFWVKIAPQLELRKIGAATFVTDDSLRRFVEALPSANVRRDRQSKQAAA